MATDEAEKIAREAILALISVPESTIGHRSEQAHLAARIRAYGDTRAREAAETIARYFEATTETKHLAAEIRRLSLRQKEEIPNG